MATKVRERHGGSLDKYRDKDIEMMEALQEFPQIQVNLLKGKLDFSLYLETLQVLRKV